MFCRIRWGWHSKVKTWLELIHSRVQTKPTAMVAMMNKNAGFKNEFWTYLYKQRRQGFRSVWLYFKRCTVHFYLNVNAASRCLSFLTNTSLDDTPQKTSKDWQCQGLQRGRGCSCQQTTRPGALGISVLEIHFVGWKKWSRHQESSQNFHSSLFKEFLLI